MSHISDFEPTVRPCPSGELRVAAEPLLDRPLGGRAGEAAGEVAAALRWAAHEVLTGSAGPSPTYPGALGCARRAVGRLAALLNCIVADGISGRVPSSTARLRVGYEASTVYDRYFRIVRCPVLGTADQILGAAHCFVSALDDVAMAGLLPDDEAEIYRFMARFIDRSGRASDGSAEAAPRIPGEPLPWRVPPPLSPVERWRRGHQLYALTNRSAAQHIRLASGALHAGPGIAATALTRAAADVRAQTAAKSYAAAMSAPRYAAAVRPTMAPPRLAVALSESMNLDHRDYRAAMDELLSNLDLRSGDLSRPVADAFGLLLDADLHDLERHIDLTYRLVGSGAALDDHEHGSSVRSLRMLYRKRFDAYLPFLCPAIGSEISGRYPVRR
ncbi:hypothetical protein [Nocardia inohanensis]|uniref:hypothetical protein n=1 Tax=Nocardia inohanensis TaxID=209246 RepID=UPI00083140BF|nr:hypothetical protein [Nocardia inohanensis]